jgi:hypothetical protein
MAVFRPNPVLLRRQVESLRKQTTRDWQCLVGIDGADAKTHALVNELTYGDPRFRVVGYAQNVGHYRNFERLSGLVSRRAPWVAYCDQDDYWYPEKLERLTSLLKASPDNAATVATARLVDQAGSVFGVTRRKPGPLSQLLLKNEVTGCLAVFRPEVVGLALPFPDGTSAAVHDHWLAVCAAALGDVAFCSAPLQDYVQHSANVIGEPETPTFKTHLESLRRDGGLSAHLNSVSRERWGWRVCMARTLCARLEVAQKQRPQSLSPVANGRLTRQLCRQFASEVLSRRLSLRDGLSMAAAALWWPRTNRSRD